MPTAALTCVPPLDCSFHQERCEQCGTLLRNPPELTYLDMARQQWVMVASADHIEDCEPAEDSARKTWDMALGGCATSHTRRLVEGLSRRLVMGWPALREKLIAFDLGLDDVTLEMWKLCVLRDMDGAPLADQTELGPMKGDAQTLVMAWHALVTERILETVEVPRSRYDEISCLVAAASPLSAIPHWKETR